MQNWIIAIMTTLGYWGIGLLMFLENLFPPIPSELIMPLAGFTVSQGKMEFGYALLAGTLGTVLGALPWYYAGKLLGEKRVRRFADRYGKWLGLSGEDIGKAKTWFQRYGNQTVLFCRLVPGVRTFISVPAGLSEMPLSTFLAYSTVGAGLWTGLLTYAGYLLGNHYHEVEGYIGIASKVVLLALLIAAGAWVLRKKRRRS